MDWSEQRVKIRTDTKKAKKTLCEVKVPATREISNKCRLSPAKNTVARVRVRVRVRVDLGLG